MEKSPNKLVDLSVTFAVLHAPQPCFTNPPFQMKQFHCLCYQLAFSLLYFLIISCVLSVLLNNLTEYIK